MKQFYTDYPMTDKGQIIIPIKLLAYDRNKYVTVEHVTNNDGTVSKIKSGYIFKDSSLTKRVTDRDLYSLPYEDGESYPNKKAIHKELMDTRRKKSTRYVVWLDDHSKQKFKTLKDALKYFKQNMDCVCCYLMKEQRIKHRFTSKNILYCENGILSFVNPFDKRTGIKVRHVKIHLK